MKLDKAIEIVEEQHHQYLTIGVTDLTDALQLLIEAGKREEIYRENEQKDDWQLLPSETRD